MSYMKDKNGRRLDTITVADAAQTVASKGGLLLGVAPGGANPTPQTIEAFNAQITPRRADMVLLSSTIPSAPLFSNQIAFSQALGVIPQIMWDNPAGLGALTDGSQDAALLSAVFRCQSVPGPIIIRLQHEFNIANVESAASFIAGWQYVVNFFNGANVHGGNPSGNRAPNVLFFWCPNGWTPGDTGPAGIDPSPYFPGDAYVDIVGADAYFYNTMNKKQSFHDMWQPMYDIMMAMSSKPFMIGEVGVAGGISGWNKATYFTGMFGTISKSMPRCIGLCYWNASLGSGDYTVDTSGTDGAGLAAFQTGVNSYPFASASGPVKPRYGDFGSGYDGTVNFDGTATNTALATTTGTAPNLVYTLTRDVHAKVLTVGTGITVKTAGYRLYAQQLFYWQGTLQNNGNNANGNAGGATSAVGTIGVPNAGANGNGGAGFSAQTTVGLCGGAGGGGGAGSAGSGGGPKSPVAVPNDGFILTSSSNGKLIGFPTRYDALAGRVQGAGAAAYVGGGIAGANGGGDGTNFGGGGGGGGGVVYVASRVVMVSGGVVSAVGGNGGSPTTGNPGGGGGGGGGSAFVVAEAINGAPTTTLTGGAAGVGFGTGVAGVAGSAGNYYPITL